MAKASIHLIGLAFICLFLITGCSAPEPPSYTQQNYSQVEVPSALKCTIGNATYYRTEVFIFHVNALGDRIVYSPTGSYTKPLDYPRWQYRTFISRNDSLYQKTAELINTRREPNGNPIACEDTEDMPEDFEQFIDTHEKLYRNQQPDDITL